jgi:hypothetical protein
VCVHLINIQYSMLKGVSVLDIANSGRLTAKSIRSLAVVAQTSAYVPDRLHNALGIRTRTTIFQEGFLCERRTCFTPLGRHEPYKCLKFFFKQMHVGTITIPSEWPRDVKRRINTLSVCCMKYDVTTMHFFVGQCSSSQIYQVCRHAATFDR